MSALNKVSKRELWMVSLLPAALVVIVSFIVPTPAEEVHELEERLERMNQSAPSGTTLQRAEQSQAEIREAESSLEALEQQEEVLQTQIEMARRPETSVSPAASVSLAIKLDELRARLAKHGVQVTAIDDKGAGPGKATQSTQPSSPTQTWSVTVFGRWTQVRAALDDPETFPWGLTLQSMQMDERSPQTALRRWELSVSPVGGRP